MTQCDVDRSEKLSASRVGGSFGVQTGNKYREQAAAILVGGQQHYYPGKTEYREDNFQTTLATEFPCDEEKDDQHADESSARIREHNGSGHHCGTHAIEKLSRHSLRAQHK